MSADLTATLARLGRHLDAAGAPWALVGGLAALVRAAGPAERALATAGVELIATTGFDRGKNLRRELADLLEADPGPSR